MSSHDVIQGVGLHSVPTKAQLDAQPRSEFVHNEFASFSQDVDVSTGRLSPTRAGARMLNALGHFVRSHPITSCLVVAVGLALIL